MDAILTWSAWPILSVILSAIVLMLVIKQKKVLAKLDGPGGGTEPMPIFGRVFHNKNPTYGCAFHSGTDIGQSGWTVELRAVVGGLPVNPPTILVTGPSGEYGATAAAGDYQLTVVVPSIPGPAWSICTSQTNPRLVTVPVGGTVSADFAYQK